MLPADLVSVLDECAARPFTALTLHETTGALTCSTQLVSLQLLSREPADDERYGTSVAVGGDLAAVGALGSTPQGAVYLYRVDRAKPGLSYIGKLVPTPSADQDVFGQTVAVDGEFILVGAHGGHGIASRTGAAYMFRFDGSRITLVERLVDQQGSFSAKFGYDVAISGDLTVIGAPDDNARQPDAGAALVYRLDAAGKATKLAKIFAQRPEAGANFGYAVAVSGGVAVFGSRAGSGTAPASGTVDVYTVRGSAVAFMATLQAADGATGAQFGFDLALSGSLLVVGSPSLNTAAGARAGAAYVYHVDEGTRTAALTGRIEAPDGAGADVFGVAVAAWGDSILVGAHNDDAAGAANAGAGYFFNTPSTTDPLKLRPTGSGIGGGQLGASAAMGDGIYLLGARYSSAAKPGGGAALVAIVA